MYNLKFNWNIFRTDKADIFLKSSQNSPNPYIEIGHGYSRSYDKHLFDNRNDVKKILEIGTRKGSINLWLNYFPNATVYGIDLVDPLVSHERFIYENLDQSNRQQLRTFFEKHGSDFDIIIDDGLHAAYEQQVSFDECFLNIVKGGCYVIEDMHCQREEEKNGPHYRPTVNTNMDTYQMIDQIMKEKNTSCDVLLKKSEICKNIRKIEVEFARNCRWITMSKPSEIFFIWKK